jgi:hypothetical protein
MSTERDDDDALLRRLYESDAGDRDDRDDRDAADSSELAGEVERFRKMRGAIAEYARATDVEPPTRGMDELMAAARARATARPAVAPESPSFWARLRAWFAPIAAHPAMASAAMLVLVAGVASVLYMKGRVTGASDTAPARDTALASGSSTGSPPPLNRTDDAFEARLADPDETETAADSTAQGTLGQAKDTDKASDSDVDSRAVKPPRATAQAPGGGKGEGGKEEGRPVEVQLRPRPQSVDVPEAAPTSVGVGSGLVTTERPASGRGGDATIATPVPQAPPPPPPEPTKPTPTAPQTKPDPAPPAGGTGAAEDTLDTPTVDRGGGEADTVSKGKNAKLDVAQLTRQARTAAKSGDCAVVRSIGGRVKKADAAYYKATFATDTEIKKCL